MKGLRLSDWYYLCRKVILPLVKSYGDSSSVTLSPAKTRMRLRRKRPARCARTTRLCSNSTLKRPLGNFSFTVPVTSMLSSLLIDLHVRIGGPAGSLLTSRRSADSLGRRDVGRL